MHAPAHPARHQQAGRLQGTQELTGLGHRQLQAPGHRGDWLRCLVHQQAPKIRKRVRLASTRQVRQSVGWSEGSVVMFHTLQSVELSSSEICHPAVAMARP